VAVCVSRGFVVSCEMSVPASHPIESKAELERQEVDVGVCLEDEQVA
jgi:hypothetical protein